MQAKCQRVELSRGSQGEAVSLQACFQMVGKLQHLLAAPAAEGTVMMLHSRLQFLTLGRRVPGLRLAAALGVD